MRVLISGASGLVGSEVARQLKAAGHEPIKLPFGQVIASSLSGMTSGHDLVADQTVWLLVS